jgi:hypothetical protein
VVTCLPEIGTSSRVRAVGGRTFSTTECQPTSAAFPANCSFGSTQVTLT